MSARGDARAGHTPCGACAHVKHEEETERQTVRETEGQRDRETERMLTGQARAGGMHVAQDAKSLYDIAKLARRVREGYAWDLEAAKRAHDAGVLTGPFPTRPLASLSASNVLPPSAPTLSLLLQNHCPAPPPASPLALVRMRTLAVGMHVFFRLLAEWDGDGEERPEGSNGGHIRANGHQGRGPYLARDVCALVSALPGLCSLLCSLLCFVLCAVGVCGARWVCCALLRPCVRPLSCTRACTWHTDAHMAHWHLSWHLSARTGCW
jgi:hypothetical protein